ncbi:solute carrier family 35 member C2 [Contarinia nasturtii]|uniref:solute carrier family 35 member C2 n=1 Tax=Contarinia nasturtii TaxID=265458 RepID=UPI0012D424D2|nr:solute carrier family 35 member C2 [Contarinia nasturtii]XP_031618622.1 solute carrier family 35 member C2 [Contarinia nasturtii]
MTESRYKQIPINQNVHTDQEDDGEDEEDLTDTLDDDTVTIIPTNDSDEFNFPKKINENNNMQTPTGILTLLLIYFILSIGLTFYQRNLLKGFHFPFTVVLYHLLLKLVMAGLIRYLYKSITGKSRVHIDWKKSFKKLAPTGVAAGIDIGFSNWGLELVTISLYTMTKSTSIIFILFFAILFGLEKKSWLLMVTVVLISTGLCMFTYKSTQFNTLGFFFLIFASMISGIRWTFAQLIMQKSNLGLHNPIDMIYFMQPWMILPILPLIIGFEGEALLKLANGSAETGSPVMILLALKVTCGAFIAFAMEVSEFLLLSYTSSLTLSISGIFKEIFQLALAVVFYGDQISTVNMFGLVMCLSGITCHIIHKFFTTTIVKKSPLISVDGVASKSCEQQLQVNYVNGNVIKQNVKLNYYSNQNTPLLDSDDNELSGSDDSQNTQQNASEVLFDILKRRDMRR